MPLNSVVRPAVAPTPVGEVGGGARPALKWMTRPEDELRRREHPSTRVGKGSRDLAWTDLRSPSSALGCTCLLRAPSSSRPPKG